MLAATAWAGPALHLRNLRQLRFSRTWRPAAELEVLHASDLCAKVLIPAFVSAVRFPVPLFFLLPHPPFRPQNQ
jgi:hypothetical protein